jgi:predicted dehydrogenase
MKRRSIKLAIVGCGTVSERFHGPALRGFEGFAPLVMVDQDRKRAEILKNYFPESIVELDIANLRGRVDAAIVALPSHLNAPVARQLLEEDISVLIEKPFALSMESARELELAASKGSAKLAVGFIRREAVGVRMARDCIANGMLGELRCFSIEDGYVFSWESVNEFRFDPTRGGGILYDIGSHVFDMLTFWFGDIKVQRYADDCRGGVETNCYIEIETSSSVAGTVKLSWNRQLRNTAKIFGTRGTLDIQWYKNSACLTLPNGLLSLQGTVAADIGLAAGAETFPEMFLAQLRRWHASLSGGADGSEMPEAFDGRRNVELISRCREIREDMPEPWRNVTLSRNDGGRDY